MSRVLYIIIGLLVFSTTVLYSQNDGVLPLETSAMDHLYPQPAKWSGSKYTISKSFVERFYILGGASLSQVWRYDRELDSSIGGYSGSIVAGLNLAPVHAVELGMSFNDINQESESHSLNASYLFNLSSYAERTEDVLPFEVQLRGGAEYILGASPSAHIEGGLRLKYNILPSVAIFMEPGVGVCAYSGGGSIYQSGDITSSVMFGFSANIADLVSYSRRTMAVNSDYWSSNNLSDRKPLMSIKSNILYDAALIPNIELEVAIKDNWSVGAQVMCGWWLKSDNSRCWQLQAADVEGRYWFGDRSQRRALSGWFAGLFASAGFYDFQLEDTKGLQGEFYVMTGVSGGYSLPIGRRMNMEFALGVGYVVNDYQKYEVYENKYLVADGPLMRFQSIFPAKVEVSLGWLLFKRGSKRESRREYRSNLGGTSR